jgi:predicted amino acid racemase
MNVLASQLNMLKCDTLKRNKMATLIVNTNRLKENIIKLSSFLAENSIDWSLVVKILGGNRPLLEKLICDDSIKKVHSVGDSRISNLKTIKEIEPDIVTMYIKPPAPVLAKKIVQYADISLNTSYTTIEALNREAERLGKTHRVIIMIELGELREGILRDNVLSFYEKLFGLKNIKIEGLGTNLGCMYGVEPTYDKMVQLSLYKMLIEEKFNKKLNLVSAGSSITLPLVMRKKLPDGINHFRIGETAFLGVSIIDGKRFKNLSNNAFDFSAEILELEEKEMIPDGNLTDAGIGITAHDFQGDHNIDINKKSYRAIVDFGEIDVDPTHISPKDESVKFIGTTSDMTVYDTGEKKGKFSVGKQIHFKPNYMAVARLMNTKYVTKEIL